MMHRSFIFSSERQPASGSRWDLALITCVVILACLELGVRLSTHPMVEELRSRRVVGFSPAPHVFDSNNGYLYQANYQGKLVRTDFTTTVTTNNMGWRDDDFSHEKRPDTWRVALVGASFLAANQVEVPQTWAHVLEQQIGSIHGKRVEIYNFGVDGYRLWNFRQVIDHKVLDFKPDLVILWSSYAGLSSPDESYRTVTDDEVILESRNSRTLEIALREDNQGLATVGELLPKWLATSRLLNALFGKKVYRSYRFVGGNSRVKHDIYKLINSMSENCRQHDAAFVIFYRGRSNDANYNHVFRYGEPGEHLNIPTYTDNGLLPPLSKMRWPNDAHWSVEGNRIYVERTRAVFQQILTEQLEPSE